MVLDCDPGGVLDVLLAEITIRAVHPRPDRDPGDAFEVLIAEYTTWVAVCESKEQRKCY